MTQTQMHLNEINKKKRKEKMLNQTYLFNNHAAAVEKYEDLERLEKVPDTIYCVAYHRRFRKPDMSVFQQVQPQLIASPIMLSLPSKPTGK